jgi:phenylpropionate dioxygenase-like ring-hydroxylating dioxygenase large terminal subunit
MLSKEDNETLCQVGPGTTMGEMFRQYWLPALKSDELPAVDCPPVRIKLLGEELIAFRTTSGEVGLIQNACPHRGASLFFGRNEEEGLRCVYHGWKFDVAGACIDMPSEPAESNFKTKVHAKAYRTHERNGIVWAYLGTREEAPPLPELEANMYPEEETRITVLHRANNWMQGWEGEMDTVHAAFLHGGAARIDQTEPGSLVYYEIKNRSGKFSVRDTEYGTAYSMYRPAEDDTYYHRIGHMLFPCFAMVPPGPLGAGPTFIAYVPMDDYHTLEWNVFSRRRQIMPGNGDIIAGVRRTDGPDRDYIPNGTGWFDRYNLTQNFGNDFMIDRKSQREWLSYTGIRGIRQQDMAMTESMGPIMDRSREHLGTTDALIIRTRRKMLACARALQENSVVPPGVDSPEVYHQRSGGIILPRSADWWESTRELRERFDVGSEMQAAEAPLN